MPTWVIFYFLWDDPLFSFYSSIEEWQLKDPQMIELHRKIRLTALDWLYTKIAILQEQVQRMSKHAYLETWTWMQLLPHVPPEIRERVDVERTVNRMDPDFSFEQAVESRFTSKAIT